MIVSKAVKTSIDNKKIMYVTCTPNNFQSCLSKDGFTNRGKISRLNSFEILINRSFQLTQSLPGIFTHLIVHIAFRHQRRFNNLAVFLKSIKKHVILHCRHIGIDGTLNSARYISGVLRPVALLFNQAQRNRTFQKNNARSHVAGIVRTFSDMENVRLLP
ncbi:hypothetical protein TNCV_3768041 [Trichonephila clavipes]|nr:hypothetical protein TNCV_3768041 [Trichonephila clavipes]